MNQFNDEDVPAMQPELSKFFKEHEEVGEPTPGEVRRGRERLLDAVKEETKVVPLRRRWLPPEVLAVAAVLFIAVVAQLIYVTVKRGDDLQAAQKALDAAWSRGSLQDLKRAVDQCNDATCTDTGGKMLAALSLSSRLDSLDGAELGSLAALDSELSKKGTSPIAERIAQRRQQLERVEPPAIPEPPEPAAAPVGDDPARESAESANRARRAKDYEEALARTEGCTDMYPTYAPCWRIMGSVLASLAARDNSSKFQQRARKAYEKYLQLAPADDEYVPRVRAILGLDDDTLSSSEPQPETKAIRVTLKTGASTTLKPPGKVQRVAVSDPQIIDVRPIGDGLRVIAAERGTAHLVVWLADGTRAMWIVVVN